jgi:hypothetical protein
MDAISLKSKRTWKFRGQVSQSGNWLNDRRQERGQDFQGAGFDELF